jgi:hypothetical protein
MLGGEGGRHEAGDQGHERGGLHVGTLPAPAPLSPEARKSSLHPRRGVRATRGAGGALTGEGMVEAD